MNEIKPFPLIFVENVQARNIKLIIIISWKNDLHESMKESIDLSHAMSIITLVLIWGKGQQKPGSRVMSESPVRDKERAKSWFSDYE